jgi:hypothetical protein
VSGRRGLFAVRPGVALTPRLRARLFSAREPRPALFSSSPSAMTTTIKNHRGFAGDIDQHTWDGAPRSGNDRTFRAPGRDQCVVVTLHDAGACLGRVLRIDISSHVRFYSHPTRRTAHGSPIINSRFMTSLPSSCMGPTDESLHWTTLVRSHHRTSKALYDVNPIIYALQNVRLLGTCRQTA